MKQQGRPHAGVALAIVLVLLTSLALGPAIAVADDHDVANNSTDSSEPIDEPANNSSVDDDLGDGPHSLEELRDGGREIPGADPSMRWIDDSGSIFIDYPSADPLGPSAEDWEVENVLKSGSLVERDQLTVNAQRERDAPDETYVLKVVSYDTEYVEVEDEDGETRMVEVASDQREHEHELRLSGAFDRETIELQNTDGETRQVSMWLEDERGNEIDGARWSFEHESTPTSTDAGIATMGDLYQWVTLYVLLPGIVLIPASLWGANRILDKTGKGPMIPGVVYAGGAGVALLGIVLFAWIRFATLLTTLPILLGLSMVLLSFVGYLEFGGSDTIKALFVRDELTDAKSPSGEDVHDVLYQDIREQKLVRTDEDGTFVLVESGIRPFLARLIGAAPTIDVSDLKTQITLRGDKWDRLFVADPACDDVLEYQRPRLRFPLFDDSDGEDDDRGTLRRFRWSVPAGVFVGSGFGFALGGPMTGLPGLGALVGGVLGFALTAGRVENGAVEFVGAPAHMTQARQTLAAAQSEYADARTVEELEEIAWRERSRTAMDARRVMSDMDRTVTEEMLESEIGLADAIGTEDDGDESADDVDDTEPADDQEDSDDERTDRQARGEQQQESALVPIDDD